jgi:hypothetical protein
MVLTFEFGPIKTLLTLFRNQDAERKASRCASCVVYSWIVIRTNQDLGIGAKH